MEMKETVLFAKNSVVPVLFSGVQFHFSFFLE